MYTRSLCWFRRDLRLHDHTALNHALEQSQEVIGVFVFDTIILASLPEHDRRVAFIWNSLQDLHQAFTEQQGALYVLHGNPEQEIPLLAQKINADAVFTHNDYEPSAINRDLNVGLELTAHGIPFHSFKDQVIFEHNEVLKQNGEPYSVFTPYKRAWLKQLSAEDYAERKSEELLHRLKTSLKNASLPSLKTLGFEAANTNTINLPIGVKGASSLLNNFIQRIDDYAERRDFPAMKGGSYLSVHLRFGTLSIREAVRVAQSRIAFGSLGAETWLSELIWRDFYAAILSHFPHVVSHAFKSEYDQLEFTNDVALFEAWKTGQTGYPLVDAAMRQINSSGFMHNRLRMVAASFLIKDLHIDWRWGEAYFAAQLNDYDLASNNGGWQWCASTGCDAQPYFRIFNPITQSKKFDPDGNFIRRYIPEIAHLPNKYIHSPWESAHPPANYPSPIIDHAKARLLTLQRYKIALNKTPNISTQ
ncbi:MAG: deoxyribodipyrimidine photo-lyase [Pseudomonadota bacterium]